MSGSPRQKGEGDEASTSNSLESEIDTLRAVGAHCFDPVGFRFIEALARRAAAHSGHTRQLLAQRLAQAVANYRDRFKQAEQEARAILARGMQRFPEASTILTRCFDAGDFHGLARKCAELEAQGGASLAELLAHIDCQTQEDFAAEHGRANGLTAGQSTDLKSIRLFGSTWSKLRVDQQLTNAVAQAPRNAGPLNSHALVLQSLKRMRDISPDYLEQFSSYLEALLWLEQAGRASTAAQKRGGAKRGVGPR